MMINSSTHLGTADEVFSAVGDLSRSLMLALRRTIAALDPQAVEVPSPREKLIWWGTGPRKMSDGYIYMVGFRAHANLGFFRGADLPDPKGLLTGPGKKMRHVRLTSVTDIECPDVLRLIEAAIARARAGA